MQWALKPDRSAPNPDLSFTSCDIRQLIKLSESHFLSLEMEKIPTLQGHLYVSIWQMGILHIFLSDWLKKILRREIFLLEKQTMENVLSLPGHPECCTTLSIVKIKTAFWS